MYWSTMRPIAYIIAVISFILWGTESPNLKFAKLSEISKLNSLQIFSAMQFFELLALHHNLFLSYGMWEFQGGGARDPKGEGKSPPPPNETLLIYYTISLPIESCCPHNSLLPQTQQQDQGRSNNCCLHCTGEYADYCCFVVVHKWTIFCQVWLP